MKIKMTSHPFDWSFRGFKADYTNANLINVDIGNHRRTMMSIVVRVGGTDEFVDTRFIKSNIN